MEQSPNMKNDKDDKDDKKQNSIIGGFFNKKKPDEVKVVKEKFEYSKKFLGTEHIEKSHSEIKNMASVYLSPNKEIKNARVENFKQALERNGTTPKQLENIYKNYLLSFYIAICAFSFLIIFAFYQIMAGNGIISALACLSIALLSLANAFKFSFRCFQIKYQKLCSIKDYLNNKEFFPFPLNKIK